MRNTLELVEVDSEELEDVLRRVEQALDEKDSTLVRRVFASYAYVTELVEDKDTSIRRLRRLLFGSRTEKTDSVVGQKTKTPDATPPPAAAVGTESTTGEGTTDESDAPAAQGHGRNGADAYRGAERIDVPHASLRAGDACPACGEGTVYDKAPGVPVRITGQPPLAATVYQLQKLRCHLCGQVFTADTPAEAGDRKYDAMAGSVISLLKYGSGLPFNRLEGLQGDLGLPLPASTQWDIVEAVAASLAPAFDELIRQAAQGEVLHNDDTTVKILELMGEHARQEALAGAGDVADERRGLDTSGVVALRDGHRVALFFSGRRHAGENLAEVLKHRAEELPLPIQMCDALSRNLPGELRTILANCLAHARRRFVDVYDRFPEPCRHLLESLAVVYRNDAVARERRLSPEARLRFHQEASGPTMEALHDWLERQLGEKRTEPNSALGGAIGYTLKHWDELTLFLRRAGAPLDNNVCERALKKAILHRKNALFYDPECAPGWRPLYEPDLHVPVEPGQPVRLPDRVAAAHRRVGERSSTLDAVELPRRAGLIVDESGRAIRVDLFGMKGTTRGIEAMPKRQSKPKSPVPSRKPSGPAAALRQALARRNKTELVNVLMELAETDRGVLRQLTTRFDVATTPDELVTATRLAVADATDFDERQINRNFDYDYEAYGEVKRNLGRLIDSGQLRLAMELSLELMKQGSYQVEMSDEGLMTEDIEECLNVVLKALEKSDLPAAEVIAWCSAMLEKDRVGFIAREPLQSLRNHLRTTAAR